MRHAGKILLAATTALTFGTAAARADDYTDLLDILRAKGSLTQKEYRTLQARHQHRAAPDAGMEASRAAAAQAAAQAAASAAAAQQVMREAHAEMVKAEEMMASPDIVHAEPFKPGAGLTLKVGSVSLNVSGELNAFYTYSSADSAIPRHTVAGGLSDASGFDSSAVRNGLLPGAIIVSAATQQDGIDLAAVFGAYPGINSTSVGALNANNGGFSTALGTSGVDFRKSYVTAGTKTLGTIKLGRDIALFGQDAILNDQTLIGVGATGGNADPGNTSLGRIGYGYIYTDFMPQITYISPTWAGLQGSIGIFQPLNTFDFSGFSQSVTKHQAPLVEGRVTYDYKAENWSAHIWTGFMLQDQDNVLKANGTAKTETATAGEVGASLTYGPVGVLGYGYRGSGVGTTAKFFDGIADNGELRDSDGFYVQAFVKPTPKLKLVGSYGESSLYLAKGEASSNLVARNSSEVGGAYYTLTDWLTLVGEYAHTESRAHNGNSTSANSVSAGAILFY